MGDIATENYKKRIDRAIKDWSDEADRIAKELKPITDELAKLEALDAPTPADKKRIEELKKKCLALHQEMENASASLHVQLMVEIEVPPKADPDLLAKVPDAIKKIIRDKGISLGKGVVLTPDVEFDFKGKKFKKLGIKIKW